MENLWIANLQKKVHLILKSVSRGYTTNLSKKHKKYKNFFKKFSISVT